ncbi:hypothetical protein DU000_11185 [Parvibium lacunae]|uniref:Uncharacterized protein n=1 Tax=Parvibium lacunae TaxID=1888893 RepID=A0A368KYM3_9BURK|nr:hypothetical protein DU000_11185 [Parvibium lacunae]
MLSRAVIPFSPRGKLRPLALAYTHPSSPIAACGAIGLTLWLIGAYAAPVQAAPAPIASDEKSEDTENLPKLTLNPDILEQLIAAEIAAQRGYGGFALQQYLSLALRTRDPRLAKRAAELAYRQRDLDQSLQAAQLWSELAPKSVPAQRSVLELQIASGRLEEARPNLQKWLQVHKKIPLAEREGLAAELQQSLVNAPNRGQAYALFESLLRPYEQSEKIQLTLARAAMQANNTSAALVHAQKALKLNPESANAIVGLSQLASEPAQSIRLLRDFLTRYPQHPDQEAIRQTLVRQYIEQKEWEAAEVNLRQLQQQKPNDLDTLLLLARVLLQKNAFSEAESLLARYVQNGDEKANSTKPGRELDIVYLTLGQLREEAQDVAAAIQWYERVQGASQRATALARSAKLLRDKQGMAVAQQYLQQRRAQNPADDARLRLLESSLLREAKRHNEAFTLLNDALSEHEQNPDYLYEYALSAEKIGRLDILETQLRRVIALQPNDARAYNALGYSLADRNLRLPESLTLIQQALRLQPNDPMIIDSLGWVYFRMGQLEQAETYLRQAYAGLPDAEIAAHLGEVLWLRGQREQAQQIWREGQQREADNTVLQETLQRYLGTRPATP